MRSKISIEIDFENGNQPVIEILSRQSDDTRDKILRNFIQSLGHSTRWCTINYIGQHSDGGESTHRWHIIPVKKEDIIKEMELMNAVLNTDGKASRPDS